MGLPARLEKLQLVAGRFDVGADVACDHAYLSRSLLKTNQANYMIATDVAKKPLIVAKKTLRYFPDRSEVRLGYGLRPLKDNEADVIFISGLGAETIVEILEDGIDRFDKADFLLQVNGDPTELRRFLLDKPIYKEEMVKERDRYYQIVAIKKGYPEGKELWSIKDKRYQNAVFRLGTLSATDLGHEYMRKRLRDIDKALIQLRKDDPRGDELRIEAAYYRKKLGG